MSGEDVARYDAIETNGSQEPAYPWRVDSSAFVAKTANVDVCAIGPGTRVWDFTHVCNGARIGADCVLGQNVYVGPNVTIGGGCKVQNNVSVYAGVTLEDDVFVGPSVVFTNVLTPRAFVDRRHQMLPTLVKRGATIGANATIVCGNTIGEYAMVGAGAVVTHDVAPHALVVGNPARLVGFVCRCGEVLPEWPYNLVNDLLTGEQQLVPLERGMSVQCRACNEWYYVDRLLDGGGA